MCLECHVTPNSDIIIDFAVGWSQFVGVCHTVHYDWMPRFFL